MHELFFVRLFAYSIIPLLLASAHLLLDRHARTPARRIELFTVYLLAISVGASGLGGAFGHLFLADVIAEGVGWPVDSPFQLEMGFANLALGILGIMAISRRPTSSLTPAEKEMPCRERWKSRLIASISGLLRNSCPRKSSFICTTISI